MPAVSQICLAYMAMWRTRFGALAKVGATLATCACMPTRSDVLQRRAAGPAHSDAGQHMTKQETLMELTNILSSQELRTVGAGAVAATLFACGASTTSQLADARHAYDDAAASPARTRAPG